jgi:hypothetical protein
MQQLCFDITIDNLFACANSASNSPQPVSSSIHHSVNSQPILLPVSSNCHQGHPALHPVIVVILVGS